MMRICHLLLLLLVACWSACARPAEPPMDALSLADGEDASAGLREVLELLKRTPGDRLEVRHNDRGVGGLADLEPGLRPVAGACLAPHREGAFVEQVEGAMGRDELDLEVEEGVFAAVELIGTAAIGTAGAAPFAGGGRQRMEHRHIAYGCALADEVADARDVVGEQRVVLPVGLVVADVRGKARLARPRSE